MRATTAIFAFALLSAFAGFANAQSAALPKELSGRWTFAAQNRTQSFSLEEISASSPDSFAAKLTWWTSDPKCTIRSEPITGRVTPAGIAFDSKTKCDVAFTAELSRAASGWTGKAVTTSGNRVELSLTAKE